MARVHDVIDETTLHLSYQTLNVRTLSTVPFCDYFCLRCWFSFYAATDVIICLAKCLNFAVSFLSRSKTLYLFKHKILSNGFKCSGNTFPAHEFNSFTIFCFDIFHLSIITSYLSSFFYFYIYIFFLSVLNSCYLIDSSFDTSNTRSTCLTSFYYRCFSRTLILKFSKLPTS